MSTFVGVCVCVRGGGGGREGVDEPCLARVPLGEKA